MKKALISILLIFYLVSAVNAQTFLYYVPFTISAADIDADLVDFPILVHLGANSGKNGYDANDVFAEVGNDYNAIGFEDSNEQRLYFEVEYWNATEEEAYIWVKVPEISNSSDTTLNLLFEGYTDGSAYHNASMVWDNDYILVMHLNDGNTTALFDSTQYGGDMLKAGANNPVQNSTLINSYQTFSSDYAEVSAQPATQDLSQLTVTFWVNTNGYTGGSQAIADFGYWISPYGFLILFDYGANYCYYYLKNTTGTTLAVTDGGLSANHWEYKGVIWNGTDASYIQNETITYHNSFIGSLANNGTAHTLGSFYYHGAYLDGSLEEFRVSNVSRSSAWLNTAYLTQIDNLLTFSSVVEYDYSAGALLFGIIAFVISLSALAISVSRKK